MIPALPAETITWILGGTPQLGEMRLDDIKVALNIVHIHVKVYYKYNIYIYIIHEFLKFFTIVLGEPYPNCVKSQPKAIFVNITPKLPQAVAVPPRHVDGLRPALVALDRLDRHGAAESAQVPADCVTQGQGGPPVYPPSPKNRGLIRP